MQSLALCKEVAAVRINCTASPCFSLTLGISIWHTQAHATAIPHWSRIKDWRGVFLNELIYCSSRFSYCNIHSISDSANYCGSSVLLFSSSCWEGSLGGAGGGVCPSNTLLQNRITPVFLISFTTAHYLFGFYSKKSILYSCFLKLGGIFGWISLELSRTETAKVCALQCIFLVNIDRL